jgi:hypothetical protein
MNLGVLKEFLEKEKMAPQLTTPDELLFQYEGGNYLINAPQDDPAYIRLIFPNFWKINNTEELPKVIRSAFETTQRIKAAKIVLSDKKDNVSTSVEMFLPNEDTFIAVFQRNMAVLKGATAHFISLMQAA